MSVTIHNIPAVSNIGGTLQGGGNLLANQDYYVRVGARSKDVVGSYDILSPASTEYHFQTTTTEKSIQLTWDAISGTSVDYKIYFSTSPMTPGTASGFWTEPDYVLTWIATNTYLLAGNDYSTTNIIVGHPWAIVQLAGIAADAGTIIV